ncbi:unnamed protein product [Prorocentrum cordatum]|uniref:Uncharacterized protein n=1 Tax=Prorocentrum cordatum TaxID=2364126 RepID=A0ABN9UWR9_9DINO|nr:unnamed protein product [Polarella glacialis]
MRAAQERGGGARGARAPPCRARARWLPAARLDAALRAGNPTLVMLMLKEHKHLDPPTKVPRKVTDSSGAVFFVFVVAVLLFAAVYAGRYGNRRIYDRKARLSARAAHRRTELAWCQ